MRTPAEESRDNSYECIKKIRERLEKETKAIVKYKVGKVIAKKNPRLHNLLMDLDKILMDWSINESEIEARS